MKTQVAQTTSLEENIQLSKILFEIIIGMKLVNDFCHELRQRNDAIYLTEMIKH